MAVQSSPKQNMLAIVLLSIGAVICGTMAGSITTFIFLWIYGFDTYARAFGGHFLPVLSLHFKYEFLVVASMVWSLFFFLRFRKRQDGVVAAIDDTTSKK